MQLGIWTDYYMELSPADALRRLAGLGWKDVDLSAGHTLKLVKDPDWPELTNSVIYRQETRRLKLRKDSGWQSRLESVMQVIGGTFRLRDRRGTMSSHRGAGCQTALS